MGRAPGPTTQVSAPPQMQAGASVVVGRSLEAVKPGRMIAGKYRVEKELGRGGFGVVVMARHLAIDQVVAIKVLTPAEEGGWQEDAARFKREAQATAALRSEHVVRILDVDSLEDGSPYTVMEYLEGETLHHTIHSRGPLAAEEAVDHVIQVLAALGEAHGAGIVHRDLKPANVFVTRGAGGTMVAKVLDFGVSKIGAHSGLGTVSAASQPITKTGALIGTVAYMAPEQMVDAKRVDARADLFSVGIILYELLTKQTPFGPPTNPTIVTTMLTKPPMPLSALRPDLPPKLERVVMRCLEKLPERRPPTAAAAAAALAPFASIRARAALESLRRAPRPTGAAAPPEKGGPKPLAGGGRSRTTLAIGIIGAVVTVGLLGLAVGIFLASR
jgi:eukaryotic-like serine/threonine-protein kinase